RFPVNIACFRPEMALFSNFGVNHAKDVTGLAESFVRRTRVRLRAMPLISLNLQKMATSGSKTHQCP
ncbi:MAG: hypothetical protein WAU34_11775, partial [Desulfobacterales bacterium]